MSYTDQMAVLADSTDRRVQALYARLVAGELTEEQFIVLASAVLAQDESRAVSMADAALAATLTVAAGGRRIVSPRGLLPDEAVGDVRQAHPLASVIREALADPDPETQLTVNVRDRVLDTAQTAYGHAMREQGVTSWTRQLNTGACELCQDLAGDTLPASADMYRHKGCGCSQKPLITKENP